MSEAIDLSYPESSNTPEKRELNGFNARVNPALEELRVMPARMGLALQAHVEATQKAASEPYRTPEWRHVQRHLSQTGTEELIADTEKKALEMQQTIAGHIEKLITPPRPTDTTAALLSETQQTRAWQRTQRTLDSIRDPLAAVMQIERIAQNAAEASDLPSLYAMRVELPSYLQARGVPAEQIRLALHQLEVIHLSRTLAGRRALEVQKELQRGMVRLKSSFAFAREATGNITRGAGADYTLFGWSDGEMLGNGRHIAEIRKVGH